MFAGFQKLHNLCVIVDNNGLQIDGDIDTVCSPNPIDRKFEAFGFNVLNIHAHDFESIAAAFTLARAEKEKPTAIIAHSVKGKGVSFMENEAGWHGSAPNEEQYRRAMQELTEALQRCENE